MKYNIIFILKLRKSIFNYYQENKYYNFKAPKKYKICNIKNYFDIESRLFFILLSKRIKSNTIYILKKICNYNLNILVSMYDNKDDMLHVFDTNTKKCTDYINKNIMSCILFTCTYNSKYYIFSSFVKGNYVTFDKNNDVQLDLLNYYYDINIDQTRVVFSDDIIKYIKLGDKFKLTKYYPFYINL